MSCKTCKSPRIANVGGKCSDLSWANIPSDDIDYQGYVAIFGDGDYININICLDCGQVQDDFPITREEVKEIFDGDEGDY